MKTIYILSAILLLNFTATAQKNVVALHSGETVTFFEGHDALSTAYNASQNGDILYLSGGSFPGIDINKSISIIGVGVHPDSVAATLPTTITGNMSINSSANNAKIVGLEILGNLTKPHNRSVSNIEIFRVKVNGFANFATSASGSSGTAENWHIRQCIFVGTASFGTVINSLIENNYFNKSIGSSTSNTFKNNLILEEQAQTWQTMHSNMFWNNIFFQTDNNIFNNSWSASNEFQHNIFAASTPDLGSSPVEVNNHKGVNLSTALVNYTGGDFSYEQNYRLTSAAQSDYPGKDDVGIGVYAGTFPFKDGLMPAQPHIYEKNIAPTINSEGKLEVEVKVRAQN